MNQFNVRNPKYLEEWQEVFDSDRSNRGLIEILKRNLKCSQVHDEMMRKVESFTSKLTSNWQEPFSHFIKSKNNRFNFTLPVKNEDLILNNSSIILDVMSGTWKIWNLFREYLNDCWIQPKVIFSDKSDKMLDNIRSSRRSSEVLKVDVLNMNGLESSTIDVVTCRYGFNNLAQNDWSKALDEVMRVLKPNGLFIIQDHFVPWEKFTSYVNLFEVFIARLEWRNDCPYIFSTEEFQKLLDNHKMVTSHHHILSSLVPNQKERLRIKAETYNLDFEKIWNEYIEFVEWILSMMYSVTLLNPEEIPVYNVTYWVRKACIDIF